MLDVRLKPSQQAKILVLINEFGLTPLDFEWTEEESAECVSVEAVRFRVSVLTHRPSNFFCSFKGYWVEFSPAPKGRVAHERHNGDFNQMVPLAIQWLTELRKEIAIPDPWAALRRDATDRLGQAERATTALEEAGSQTAASELREATVDLSRQPPDLTGAVQHSLAALECVAREHCSDHATFGKLLQRYDGLFPKPLDKGIEMIWGFASEMGRHLQEGRTPNGEEAELLVGLATACCTYLARKGKPVDH